MSAPKTAVILNPREALSRLRQTAGLCNEYDGNNFLSDCDLRAARDKNVSFYVEVKNRDNTVTKYESPLFKLQRAFVALLMAEKNGRLEKRPVEIALKPKLTEILEDETTRVFYNTAPGCVRFDVVKYTGGQQGVSTGSGWVWKKTDKGYLLLTNHHVVEGLVAGQVRTFPIMDGHEPVRKLRVLGADPFLDVAVVEIETQENLTVLESGISSSFQTGDTVYAIGNPLGLPSSFTTGTINNPAQVGSIVRTIQHTALILPGNSGGPLLNKDGFVIGINTFMPTFSNGTPVSGLGFAYPIDDVDKMAAVIVAGNGPRYGWLGVDLIQPRLDGNRTPPFVRDGNNGPPMGAVQVARVIEDSEKQVLEKEWLIHRAEVEGGRFVVEDNNPSMARQLFAWMARQTPGKEVRLLVSVPKDVSTAGGVVSGWAQQEVSMPIHFWVFH